MLPYQRQLYKLLSHRYSACISRLPISARCMVRSNFLAFGLFCKHMKCTFLMHRLTKQFTACTTSIILFRVSLSSFHLHFALQVYGFTVSRPSVFTNYAYIVFPAVAIIGSIIVIIILIFVLNFSHVSVLDFSNHANAVE